MKQRLEEVQKVFRRLVGFALILGLLAYPFGDDGATIDALRELERFEAGFNQADVESSLLKHAGAKGLVPLADVARQVTGPGVPKVIAAKAAPPIRPLAQLDLGTLEKVHALGEGVSVEIAAPEVKALAASLAWRLTRQAGPGRYVLESVELTSGAAAMADVAREVEIALVRVTALDARPAFEEATAVHAKAEELHKMRLKWNAPWKAVVRAEEQRQEAKAEMNARKKVLDESTQRYESLAQAALAKPATGHGALGVGLAKVTLSHSGGGSKLELTMAVALPGIDASVPALSSTEFAKTRAAGLWDLVKSEDAASAVELARGQLSWRALTFEVGPIQLGIATLLTWAPVLLLVLLGMLVLKVRQVGSSYDPFHRTSTEPLPGVGLHVGFLDVLPLVALPMLVCALCAWSLTELQQFAVVPILGGLVSIGLGSWAFMEIRELNNLRDAVSRSFTRPPQEPEGDGQ